ncbi:MAG: F0F1 ATP synthase subunit gamma, partial [Fidelibacterota bacterium]
QDVIVEPMLPLVPPPQEDYPEFRDYIFEPSIKEIVDSLVPLHLNVQMWRILLESNAAEQGARMTAMENATENAKEIISHLRLTFNKARQAAITKDMLEIVGPTEVMRKAAE